MRNPWKKLILSARKSAAPGQIKKNGIKRTEALDVTIDDIYLSEQFQRQNYKCYWTDYPIDPQEVFKTHNPLSPSLDRLDESKGYIPGNIVISLRLFNLGRQRCPELKFRGQIEDLKKHFTAVNYYDTDIIL